MHMWLEVREVPEDLHEQARPDGERSSSHALMSGRVAMQQSSPSHLKRIVLKLILARQNGERNAIDLATATRVS